MQDIRAGDTLSLTVSYSDYPATTWTATLVLVNASYLYEATATADGNSFDFDVVASSTGLWTAGTYTYFVSVTDGTDTYTAETGTVKILPAYTSAVDLRSDAKKMLDALLAVYLGRASRSDASYSVAGRSITSFSPAELRAEIMYWQNVYNEELRQEKITNGESASSNVFIKFVD